MVVWGGRGQLGWDCERVGWDCEREDGWLVRKEGYFWYILKFIYLYNQFYMISWVFRLKMGCFMDSLSNKRPMCP